MRISLILAGTVSLIHSVESDIMHAGLGASAISRYPGSDEVARRDGNAAWCISSAT